jgi:hypothetical protein
VALSASESFPQPHADARVGVLFNELDSSHLKSTADSHERFALSARLAVLEPRDRHWRNVRQSRSFPHAKPQGRTSHSKLVARYQSIFPVDGVSIVI